MGFVILADKFSRLLEKPSGIVQNKQTPGADLITNYVKLFARFLPAHFRPSLITASWLLRNVDVDDNRKHRTYVTFM